MNIQITMENYLNELESNKSAHTIKSYRSALQRFVKWLDESWDNVNELEYITPSIIRDYKAFLELKYKPATSNQALIVLKNLLEYAESKGVHFVTSPLSSIKLKSVAQQNETKWLERSDIPKLFHAIDVMERTNDVRKSMYRAIIGVLVNCGLRVSEVVALKADDVNMKGGMIYVRGGKGDKYRTVPFGAKTAMLLHDWLAVREDDNEFMFYSKRSPQMTTRAVQHIVQRLSNDTGIDFTVHQLRHTFAKNVADSTGRIEAVSSLLGHTSIQTTKRYIEPSMKELQAYVSEVESY
ncbi:MULTISPECIES: tyrosine-type recombinase/integrase [Exiguobacterium]|uniref:tyrosine-type recombinase/integrase n=1 Tax=Exiguobacterium sp. UBA1053 TaxID=1946487 RepID=UPI0025BC685C|nr:MULTISPECIES: tyrosine-type recombinase/integrase [Exiguobacterium]